MPTRSRRLKCLSVLHGSHKAERKKQTVAASECYAAVRGCRRVYSAEECMSCSPLDPQEPVFGNITACRLWGSRERRFEVELTRYQRITQSSSLAAQSIAATSACSMGWIQCVPWNAYWTTGLCASIQSLVLVVLRVRSLYSGPAGDTALESCGTCSAVPRNKEKLPHCD